MKNFFKWFLTAAFGSLFGFFVAMLTLFVVIPLVIAIFAGGRRAAIEPIKAKSILHLHLHGALVDRHQPMDFDIFQHGLLAEDRNQGLYEINKAIEYAKTDKRIEGIYLELGNFESGWAGVSALRRRLAEFVGTGKWVVAYAEKLDEMGYYLGSAANQLYVEPYGDVEFNGLTMQEMFVKGLLQKLEVEPEIFRVGRFKAAVEPLIREEMSKENREQTQALIDDLWSEVRESTARETKLAPARIDEIAAKLEVVSAETAKAAKLITDTKFVDEVEAQLKKQTVGEDNDLELVTANRLLRDVGDRHKSGKKKIALLFAEGEIHDGESGRDSIGSDDMRSDIEDARADDDVAAIVVRVNSPGGDALASDVIWRSLRQADDELPVVISMGDTAASGGYYMSAAGRYVFAEPSTITGSIGVFGMMFNTQKFFKNKAGIGFDKVVTHPHADIGSMARPVTAEEGRVIQAGVERIYKRFLDVVEESRGFEKRSDLESIAEGRVWSGKRAKELGLVDELGGLEQAIAKAAEFAELKEYQIEVFPSEVDPIRHLIERLSGDTFAKVFNLGFGMSELNNGLSAAKQTVGPIKNGVYARMMYDLRIR